MMGEITAAVQLHHEFDIVYLIYIWFKWAFHSFNLLLIYLN